jgi:putative oxygen-independent coproporphyrinogen III oxidase
VESFPRALGLRVSYFAMNRLVFLLRPPPRVSHSHGFPPLRSLPSLRSLFIPSLSRLPASAPRVRSLHAQSATGLASSLVIDSRVVSDEEGAALPSSVYVHIPFCRRRCFYCDFPIVAVGERTDGNKAHMDAGMADYVELVCREIRLAAKVNGSKPLKTVFFGGGTPSLLPPPLLLRIVETLDEHFGIESGAEVSIEMDPGTFDVHSLRQLMDGGLSRVSMGVQSFQAALLKSCGRSHGLSEVYEAVEAIHASGLSNWSLDLISSLPHQTLEDWEHSINEAVKASPAHVSVYDLQIEEGTLFNKWYKPGQSPLPSDDNAAEFYRMASAKLQEAGFAHYEISNYAKEGFQCKHNLVYWNSSPYFAFGLGSTSYVSAQRFSRPRKFKQYREFVENFVRSGGRIECPQDSKEERALDTVMLSLRLARGLDLQAFAETFGAGLAADVCEALLPFVSSGHVLFMDAGRQTLDIKEAIKDPSRFKAYVRLTDPNGFLLSNEVIASIFSALPSGEHSQYRACAVVSSADKSSLKP